MLNIDDRILDQLNESEMYLCLQILRYMKPERMTAWPSMETLCKACGWSPNTFRKHRKSLLEKGVLSIEEKDGGPHIYSFKTSEFGVFIAGSDPYQNLVPLPKNGIPKIEQSLPKFGTPPLPKFEHDPYQNLVHEEISKEEISNSIVVLSAGEKTENEKPAAVEQKTDSEKAELEIFSWAKTSTGAASILNRYQQAKKTFSEADFQADVIGFCGWYLTRVDEQITARFKKDFAGFFYANLYSWLTNPGKRKPAGPSGTYTPQSGYRPLAKSQINHFSDSPKRAEERQAF